MYWFLLDFSLHIRGGVTIVTASYYLFIFQLCTEL